MTFPEALSMAAVVDYNVEVGGINYKTAQPEDHASVVDAFFDYMIEGGWAKWITLEAMRKIYRT